VIQRLVIALFMVVFTIEYVVKQRALLSGYFILVPEVMSAIAMLIVFGRMVAGARIAIDMRYLLFMLVLCITLILGFTLQEVPTGAVLAGAREHLKFLPFFLLPAVYRFTPAQLKTQLAVLLVMFVLETPLALYQRFVEFASMMSTGDPVRGTATTSSALSMLLLCGIAAVVALYLRGKIKFRPMLLLVGVLFIPTTINETKATVLLLPVALIAPALYMPKGKRALRKLVPVAVVGLLTGVVFFAVYDSLIRHREDAQPLGQFFSSDSVERYLYTGGRQPGMNYIGRFDSLQIAAEHISRDPLTFAIGLGAGNVNTSFLPAFDGKYASYYERYGVDMTQVTMLLWEIGVLGTLAYLALYWFVYRDARLLARGDDAIALLGQIWVAVIAIMTFALIYKAIFAMNEIGYLFWFYSGVVASEAVLRRRERRTADARARASFHPELATTQPWAMPALEVASAARQSATAAAEEPSRFPPRAEEPSRFPSRAEEPSRFPSPAEEPSRFPPLAAPRLRFGSRGSMS
jgi:hypothetical protein